MPFAHPHVTLPGEVVRVKRPKHDRLECHCSLNVINLFGDDSIARSVPLARCQLHELQMCLPQRFQTCWWKRLYDTATDGFSLSHFYRKSDELSEGQAGICLLSVASRDSRERSGTSTPPPPPDATPSSRTTSAASSSSATAHAPDIRGAAAVIGCFASEVPNLRHNPHHFYGSRETFVFSLSKSTGAVVPHFWSGGGNDEFLLSSHHFFGVGGGRDGAALFIDEDLQYGTCSARCATFDCPPLFGKPRDGLHHSEFVVLRMQWFALCAQSKWPGDSAVRGDNNAGGHAAVHRMLLSTGFHDTEPTPCSCGRGAHAHICGD